MAQQHRRWHVGGRPVSKHLAEHSQYQVRNTHTCARNLDSENSRTDLTLGLVLSNTGICIYMALISAKSSTTRVRRLTLIMSTFQRKTEDLLVCPDFVFDFLHRGGVSSIPLRKEPVGEHY